MKLLELRAQITNPFNPDYFKNLGAVYGKIMQHWAWELEHTFYPRSLLDINIGITVKEDHQGFDFEFGILGYGVHFTVYDMRHYER